MKYSLEKHFLIHWILGGALTGIIVSFIIGIAFFYNTHECPKSLIQIRDSLVVTQPKYKVYYEYDVYRFHDNNTGKLTGDSIIIPVDTIHVPIKLK